MKKDLLKLLATVTVAGLLVGCGSSSSDDVAAIIDDNISDIVDDNISDIVDDNPTIPSIPTFDKGSISLVDGKLVMGTEELDLNSLAIIDGNTTHIKDTDDNETYAISSLYYADGNISIIDDINNSMLTPVDTNVTLSTIVVEDNTITGDVTLENILPSF